MGTPPLRCYECRSPLDARASPAAVELNPSGEGTDGFHRGHLCTDCEAVLSDKLEQTSGGNI
jgi:hypothetical protein